MGSRPAIQVRGIGFTPYAPDGADNQQRSALYFIVLTVFSFVYRPHGQRIQDAGRFRKIGDLQELRERIRVIGFRRCSDGELFRLSAAVKARDPLRGRLRRP